MKVGIIGCGFVGGAVAQGFGLCCDLKLYDKHKNIGDLDDVCTQDILFLCLPTNSYRNGEQDLSDIYEVAEQIDARGKGKIIIIKSTVLPGTTRQLAAICPEHTFIMSPEFLTARAARLDFINSARIVLGVKSSDGPFPDAIPAEVIELHRRRFVATPIYVCTWEEAELLKYMCNCFFALKISFCNEIYDLCQHVGADYKTLRNMFLADGRIGNSHTDVPGHDGDRGFGGTCFPKDTAAFTRWARGMKCPSSTVEAAVVENNWVRKNKDWKWVDDDVRGNDYSDPTT